MLDIVVTTRCFYDQWIRKQFRQRNPFFFCKWMSFRHHCTQWIIHGQVDCGFLSSIVADDLKFYPLMDDPLCAVMPKGHPLTEKERVTVSELFSYPLIIETPGCDNDIQHLLAKCSVKPKITYSFRDDTLIMAFVKSGLGVTISQKMVLKAFARDDVESRPLEPASHRTLGLAFSKTANSVVSGIMLEYLKKMTG